MKHRSLYCILSYQTICYFLILFLSSCISQKNSDIDDRVSKLATMEASASGNAKHSNALIISLQKELMDLHDSIMPAMSKLMQLKRQLKIKLQDDQNKVDRGDLKQIRDAVMYLESADAAMMDWMRNYKTSFEGMSDLDIERYLTEEKEQIENVKQKMLSSIHRATIVLAKCNK
jgi:hypothetical protein